MSPLFASRHEFHHFPTPLGNRSVIFRQFLPEIIVHMIRFDFADQVDFCGWR
ncbi:MAG: hypothetical protein ACK58L_13040 [Planctomycetota bacterium]